VNKIYLNIKTGYTFKAVYGHLDAIAEKCAKYADFAGIADLGNTFAHIPWQKACKKANIKPIYGVQLPVTKDLQRGIRRYPFNWMTFIAKDASGLQEIYRLVDLSFQQFYYRQRITYDQINALSDQVYVLSGVAPRWDLITRQVYKELSPATPYNQRSGHHPQVACCDNYYPDPEDDIIYEPFADERLREKKMSPIHILDYDEYKTIYSDPAPLSNLIILAGKCNVDLPEAPMVKYIGKDNIEKWCEKGAREKSINIYKGLYAERYKKEMKLIKDKDYVDYFLVVADLIRYAKTIMAVGPARGCFLPGQRVHTFNGNSRKIETLKPGDKIKSSFGSTQKILDIFEYEIKEKILDIEFEDGTLISCTSDHKFLTIDGWIKACDLTESDDICNVRKNSKSLSKLEQGGWNIVAAHRFLHFGYVDWECFINHPDQYPNLSKKEVKFTCEICKKECLVQIRKILNRINGLAYKKICCSCINREARNMPQAKADNSKAQLIAQNKPEQIAKNSAAQIKRHNKDWCVAKYDPLFSDEAYKKYARYDVYKNTCQLCRRIGNDLHHIDGEKDSNIDNIILLCKSCHTRYHNNKRYNDKWIPQKEKMLKNARSHCEN
jgi:intein/homing endonuclease